MDRLLEELRKRQKRYTKEEKEEFFEFLKDKLNKLDYSYRETKTKFLNSLHLETETENDPKIVLLAHYDTSTTIPVWFEWIIRLSGHTRSLLIFIIMFSAYQLVLLSNNSLIIDVFRIGVVVSIIIPLLFIPNKHTMNDNTSGILALLILAERISKDDNLKSKVKFVFTDNEEKALVGSFQLKKIWEKSVFQYSNSKIISIDSIGRGETAVISYNFVDNLAKELKKHMENDFEEVKSINMWFTPFSDAFNFWRQGAVNINMMDKSIIPGGYCIQDIHSKRDTYISEMNIKSVTDSIENYIRKVLTD